jgi:hypothetical protein
MHIRSSVQTTPHCLRTWTRLRAAKRRTTGNGLLRCNVICRGWSDPERFPVSRFRSRPHPGPLAGRRGGWRGDGVGPASTFDAGVLLLWVDERHWGKLCFEFSPAGDPMIVSVVCRGVADAQWADVAAVIGQGDRPLHGEPGHGPRPSWPGARQHRRRRQDLDRREHAHADLRPSRPVRTRAPRPARPSAPGRPGEGRGTGASGRRGGAAARAQGHRSGRGSAGRGSPCRSRRRSGPGRTGSGSPA